MNFDAISPIDGRYRAEAEPLAAYFSERALVSERVQVELAYLRLLASLGVAPKVPIPKIRADFKEVKALEDELGHDVKAAEVFVRRRLQAAGRAQLAPYVHLGLTSEDTNSLAFAVLLKEAKDAVLVPAYSRLASFLAEIASREASTPMTARTHGRPAVPTTFGKELAVFAVRIAERTGQLRRMVPMAKFSGAVGTYASFGLMGKKDWVAALSGFVSDMGVEPTRYSTQVVPGERLSDILHCVINLNQLMASLSRDLWMYQTLDLIHFARPGKVSSSTMPQKVNPVDLENAEGQSDVSTSILQLLAYRLQTTRLQRDLSDSILRRMVGQALAHSLVASGRLLTSLKTMAIDRSALKADLGRHPEVFAEREQILRRLSGDELGYEKVKELLEKGKFVATHGHQDYTGDSRKLAKECPKAVRMLLKP